MKNSISALQATRKSKQVYSKLFEGFSRAKTLKQLQLAAEQCLPVFESGVLSEEQCLNLESYGNSRANFILAESRRIESVMRSNKPKALK